MKPPILDVYFSVATPIAIAVVLIAALAQYLNYPGNRIAPLAIAVLGLIAAFFAPAFPIVLGAGYLAYVLYTQRGGLTKITGEDAH